MSDFGLSSTVAIGVVIGAISLLLLVYLVWGRKNQKKSNGRSRKKSRSDSSSAPPPPSELTKQKKLREFKYPLKKGGLLPHPLSAADFKGHIDCINCLAFEPGGKYLASCSDDRTIRIWAMKTAEDKEHKYTRINLEDNDHATNIVFSPDGTAILLTTALSNSVIVYKLSKSKGTLSLAVALQFELANDTVDENILSLEIALNGRYIMICSKTVFSLWTLKGDKLSTIETRQSPNNFATISKCSNFIACCGFTTDVKIWEVVYSKANEFQKVNRAMELKGHSAGVLSVSFSQDSKRAVTLSKDKTLKLWNIDVSYSLNEDPRVILTIELDCTSPLSQLALSPDSLVVSVAYGTSIAFYSTHNGHLLQSLKDVHNADITSLLFEPNGRFLVSAGGHDRFIRLWHNVPGMREQVRDLQQRLVQTTSDTMKSKCPICDTSLNTILAGRSWKTS